MTIDLVSIVTLLALGSYAAASIGPPVANTTSGLLIGVPSDGINVFTGIRFAEAPIGPLRWEPPVPFRSSRAQNATSFGPSCLQTFPFQTRDFFMNIFNTPGPITGENEDCLFLNVWAPASSAGLKPVLVWIYGGALEWGASSLPLYDGLSIAKQQDIVFVTFNYRTNVFGFPASPDLPIAQNNLGYLDQELLFGWIQSNIGAFGGDKSKVTIMGWSAGSVSVADAIVRHNVDTAPFRAGIMVSSATSSLDSEPNTGPFNEFATAMNCTQPAGSAARLACLKKIPAEIISDYTNGPDSGAFTFSTTIVADNVTKFTDPFERIRKGNSAQTPVLLGAVENEGTFRAANVTDLANSTAALLPPARILVTAEELLALYPNQTAMEIAANATRDDVMRCSDSLFAKALFDSGITSVFRYTYGALFPDTQPFPGAGVWHGADLPIIFGTFNKTTATQAEAELSRSFQTAIGNFVKDPFSSPAPNWLPYVPGNRTKTLARIAYHGNVAMHNFIDPAISDSIDGNCATFWNQFLDFTSS